jgi:hypothetical protein
MHAGRGDSVIDFELTGNQTLSVHEIDDREWIISLSIRWNSVA